MKDIMIRCALLLVFSCSISFCIPVYSQDLHQTVKIADSLYQSNQLDQAIKLYKRIAFFDRDEVYDTITFPRLANSYFQAKDYQNASRYFEYSYNVSEDVDYLYDQALMQILSRDYKLAKLGLLNVSTNEDELLKARKLALLVMVDFKLGDYQSAENYLSDFYDHTPIADSLGFDLVAKTSKIKKRYKKSKVKAMSLIIPGAGQMYCGDFKEGINSLGITVLFGGIYFRVVSSLGLLDAFLSVLPWYQKYYLGGYTKAGVIAVNKQQELLGVLFNEMVFSLEKSLSQY